MEEWLKNTVIAGISTGIVVERGAKDGPKQLVIRYKRYIFHMISNYVTEGIDEDDLKLWVACCIMCLNHRHVNSNTYKLLIVNVMMDINPWLVWNMPHVHDWHDELHVDNMPCSWHKRRHTTNWDEYHGFTGPVIKHDYYTGQMITMAVRTGMGLNKYEILEEIALLDSMKILEELADVPKGYYASLIEKKRTALTTSW